MDATRFKELQDDEQREETMDSAIRAVVEGELVDVHTALPGIIKSFDAAKQTAVVQPAIKRLFIGKGFVDLPQCLDVPVAFPRWGNFVLTGPVSPGDEGLLKFAERAIDFWWDRGGSQKPAEPRMHDLSDAFFEPSYSSRGRVPANISGDAVELRTLDGSTVLRVENNQVIAGSVAGAKSLPTEDYHAALDKFLTVIVTELGAALDGLGLSPAHTTLTQAQQAFEQVVSACFTRKFKGS